MTNPYVTQINFRGYADDDVMGSNTPKAAIDDDWTQDVDENFRLRFALEESNNKAINNPGYKIEYKLNAADWTEINRDVPVVLSR